MRSYAENILANYVLKVREERKARLAGRVVEADFYLRQITWLEVALDVGSGDGWKLFEDLRCGRYHIVDIAATRLTMMLDRRRRIAWGEAGEPPRPEHPREDYLEDQGGYFTEPLESTRGALAESHQEQRRRFEERHARDAQAQVEWEAQARRDYEARSTESKTDGT